MGDKRSSLIEARQLVKHYGATQAVRDISFSVARGEVVGFLGPNGAGKSTTMKMLTGYLRPTGGQARVAGHDVQDDPLAARRVLGYLPESAPLYDDMMVIDFLRFIADLRGVPAAAQARRTREVCERCGLMGVLGKDIGQLSKGYRQRVGLAQALVHDPDLLILDEPTSGLDPNQIIEIRELIRDLGQDKTVLLSTHILPEVQATCSRILIISDGKLVADDTPDALIDRGAGAVVRVVLKPRAGHLAGRESLQAWLHQLPGVTQVEPHEGEGNGTHGFILRSRGTTDVREAVFEACAAARVPVLDLHRERVSLEDTFRRLTRGEEVETLQQPRREEEARA